jgi:hypothetical protein
VHTRVSITAGALAGLLAGCNQNVDLTAVQKFAETTAAAGTSFDALASDWASSCQRRWPLVAEPRALAGLHAPLRPGYRWPPAPPAGPAGFAPTAAAPSLDLKALANLSDCKVEAGLSRSWRDHNAIVLNYVRALGAIAKVDKVPKFDSIGTELESAKIVSKPQVDAFQSLLNTIALAETRIGQEDAIARAAVAVKDDLPAAVAALKLADSEYSNALAIEYDGVISTYSQLICEAVLSAGRVSGGSSVGRCILPPNFPSTIRPADRLRIEQYTNALTERVDSINAKRAATIGYADALDTIVATNQEIVDRAQHKVDFGVVVEVVKKHVVDLVKAVSVVQKAVK